MKKSTVTIVIALLIILTVCLYFISGTYARYADSRSGNATVSVAKWSVSITDGTDPLNSDFTLNTKAMLTKIRLREMTQK